MRAMSIAVVPQRLGGSEEKKGNLINAGGVVAAPPHYLVQHLAASVAGQRLVPVATAIHSRLIAQLCHRKRREDSDRYRISLPFRASGCGSSCGSHPRPLTPPRSNFGPVTVAGDLRGASVDRGASGQCSVCTNKQRVNGRNAHVSITVTSAAFQC